MLKNLSVGKKGHMGTHAPVPPRIRPVLTSLGKIKVKGILEQFIGKQYKIIIKRVAGNRDSDKSCLHHVLKKWALCKCIDGSYRIAPDVTRLSIEIRIHQRIFSAINNSID